MRPVSLATFRALSRAEPARARALWSKGLGVAFDDAACASAACGLAEADLVGYRYGVVADIGCEAGDMQLPRPLLAALRMEPGWLGCGADGNGPMQEIGAALALLALGAAQMNQSVGCGEVRCHPSGGVRVQRP